MLCVQATQLLKHLTGYFHECCGFLRSNWSESKGMGPCSCCHCLGNIFLTTSACAVHMEIMKVFLKQDLSDMSLAHKPGRWCGGLNVAMEDPHPELLSQGLVEQLSVSQHHTCVLGLLTPQQEPLYRLWPQMGNGHAHSIPVCWDFRLPNKSQYTDSGLRWEMAMLTFKSVDLLIFTDHQVSQPDLQLPAPAALSSVHLRLCTC